MKEFKLEAGDIVMSLVDREFTDKTFHSQGQLIEVQENTLAYYTLFLGSDYQFIRKKDFA